jgi:hypothetical protein
MKCMIISNLENYMIFRNLIHLVNVKVGHGHNIVKLKVHTHTHTHIFCGLQAQMILWKHMTTMFFQKLIHVDFMTNPHENFLSIP